MAPARPGPVGVVVVVGRGRRVRFGAVAVNLLLLAADRAAFRSSALFFRSLLLESRTARVVWAAAVAPLQSNMFRT